MNYYAIAIAALERNEETQKYTLEEMQEMVNNFMRLAQEEGDYELAAKIDSINVYLYFTEAVAQMGRELAVA